MDLVHPCSFITDLFPNALTIRSHGRLINACERFPALATGLVYIRRKGDDDSDTSPKAVL
jgi:hypothetical protein